MKDKNKPLSPKQLEVIGAIIASPDLPWGVIAEQNGIGDTTLWRWRKDPKFQEEIERRMRDKWAEAEYTAMENMISLCRSADFRACKYILDNFGYGAPKKIEVTGEISNPMEQLTLEELKKLAAE